MEFLKRCISYDCLGLIANNKIINLTCSYGVSLLSEIVDINEVKALTKQKGYDNNTCLMKIKKFFNIATNEIEMSMNKKLPKWLHCDVVNEVLIINGIPKIKDQNELIL